MREIREREERESENRGEREMEERGEREVKKYMIFLFPPSKGMGILKRDKGFKVMKWVKGK